MSLTQLLESSESPLLSCRVLDIGRLQPAGDSYTTHAPVASKINSVKGHTCSHCCHGPATKSFGSFPSRYLPMTLQGLPI